ncbi:MAG: polyprenyl synthetase family protein [Syntrophomonadaceae bacterium]
MEFDLFKLVRKEMELVEQSLYQHVNTSEQVLSEASTHLIKAGGKRIRPGFALLVARMYRDDIGYAIPLATALELVHMATLVHDDVIDNSEVRRGTGTVKRLWGNRVAIYAGNFVFARALDLIASYNRQDILEVVADASMKICQGEIEQMLSCFNVNLGLKNYLRRIERKTALLISLSCQVGAMLSTSNPKEIEALRRYGYDLGLAFQITDDILDFVADEATLGKPTGSDIRQGVITLPALYALHHDARRDELAQLLSSPQACQDNTQYIIDIVCESDGIEYAYSVSQHYAHRSKRHLAILPDTPVKENLLELADFILTRDY